MRAVEIFPFDLQHLSCGLTQNKTAELLGVSEILVFAGISKLGTQTLVLDLPVSKQEKKASKEAGRLRGAGKRQGIRSAKRTVVS